MSLAISNAPVPNSLSVEACLYKQRKTLKCLKKSCISLPTHNTIMHKSSLRLAPCLHSFLSCEKAFQANYELSIVTDNLLLYWNLVNIYIHKHLPANSYDMVSYYLLLVERTILWWQNIQIWSHIISFKMLNNSELIRCKPVLKIIVKGFDSRVVTTCGSQNGFISCEIRSLLHLAVFWLTQVLDLTSFLPKSDVSR